MTGKVFGLFVAAGLAVASGLVLAASVLWSNGAPAQHQPQGGGTSAALAALKPIEAWGAARDQREIAGSLAMVQAFFTHAEKVGAPAFAADALGAESQACQAEDWMPWSDGKNLAEHLATLYSADIFTPAELRQEIAAAVNAYVQGRQATDNRMLVRVEEDIPALGGAGGQVNPVGKAEFAALYNQSLARLAGPVSGQTDDQITEDIANLVGSYVAGDLAGYLATQLGVAGGVDAAGAAASPETLGISFIAALAVSYAADKIYGAVEDPAGQIAKKTCDGLETYRHLLMNGTGKQPGLVAVLHEAQAQWQAARDTAFRQAIVQYEAQHD